MQLCCLDRFKNFNDLLGHDGGDELLLEMAARLSHCVREEDTVARLGGDEFAVLMEDVVGTDEATSVAGRICASLAAAVRLPEGDAALAGDVVVVHHRLGVGDAFPAGPAEPRPGRRDPGTDGADRSAGVPVCEDTNRRFRRSRHSRSRGKSLILKAAPTSGL